jgi:hypothetical protein
VLKALSAHKVQLAPKAFRVQLALRALKDVMVTSAVHRSIINGTMRKIS